jgi:hypothetical protein
MPTLGDGDTTTAIVGAFDIAASGEHCIPANICWALVMLPAMSMFRLYLAQDIAFQATTRTSASITQEFAAYYLFLTAVASAQPFSRAGFG